MEEESVSPKVSESENVYGAERIKENAEVSVKTSTGDIGAHSDYSRQDAQNSEVVADAPELVNVEENVSTNEGPLAIPIVPVQENSSPQASDHEIIEELTISGETTTPEQISKSMKKSPGSATNYLKPNRKEKTDSDIFSLKHEPYVTSSIFSISGAPSRRENSSPQPQDHEVIEDTNVEPTIAGETITPEQISKSMKKSPGSATNYLQPNRIEKTQSDIFSLKHEPYVTSSIFSISGAPSRRIYRQRQAAPNNIFPGQNEVIQPPGDVPTTPSTTDKMRDKESYHEIKRPSSSVRNPLTGTGLSSNDEYKSKGNRKKDGNPLLGVGYPEASSSSHRIPPGGFSHKLW